MKHGIHILFWMLIAALSSCTDDEIIDVPEPQPQTGIVIRLSAGDLEQTRTDLTSQANLQHVEKVYALLYRGHYKEGQTVEDTTKLIACDELNWNPEDEGNGGPHGKEYELPETENLTQGNYTVLCIGLDDNDEQEVGGSGKTYNLPGAIKNKTLSEAKATLTGGKTKDDIAKSELFAGWNQFHFAPDSLNIVEVEMKRRVAGVLCYLTDIPYTITEGSDVYRITRVQLRLFTDQNSSIKLCRDEVITNADGKASYPDDFGELPLSDSQIIDEYILEDKSYSYTSDYTLYQFDLSTNERKLAPNSILMGNYMIPIKFDSQKANQTDNKLIDQVTLQVVLLGKKVDSKEDDPKDTAQEEIVRSFPAINDDIDLEEVTGSDGSVSYEPTKNYPIRPNIIYHIGNKPSDEEEGTPESLAGTKVNIVAEEWTDQEINVEFPSVPVVVSMDLNIYTYDNGTEKVMSYENGYIFDCIGIDDQDYKLKETDYRPDGANTYAFYPVKDRLKLSVTHSILGTKWSVASTGNMIYFRQSDGKTYSSSFTPTPNPKTGKYDQDYEISVILTDYAEEYGETIRTATLTLTTYEEDGTTILNQETKTISQYNAIIVKYGEGDDEKVLGFSRYDWGTVRGIDTYTSSTRVQWRYDNMGVDYIFGNAVYNHNNDGADNYDMTIASIPKGSSNDGVVNSKAKRFIGFYGTSGKNGEDGSATYKAAKPAVSATDGSERPSSPTLKWYLPAYYEMDAFLHNSEYYSDEDCHIKQYANNKDANIYWTSSGRDDRPRYACTCFTGDEDSWSYKLRTDAYYLRQACRIR